MNTQPVIGISGCLTGSAVRFDGGHKRMGFVMDELAQWVTLNLSVRRCPSVCLYHAPRCVWFKPPREYPHVF